MDRLLKTLLPAAALFLTAVASPAQTLADRVPGHLLHLLDAKRRQALVQRYEQGQRPAQIQNLAGGTSVLDSLTADYLLMRPTSSDEIVLRRYPGGLLLIHTVLTPEPDSRLALLDTLGTEQPCPVQVSARDWYVANDTLPEAQYLDYALPFVPHWQLRGDTLSVIWDLRAYLTREDWTRVATAHRASPILYIWSSDRFHRIH